jgi:hypothetical protein
MMVAIGDSMSDFASSDNGEDELTQLRWEDAADYVGERDKKYDTSEVRIPAVI